MSWAGLAQGSQSNGAGSSSITLLKEPVRLRKPSNMLELMGRVVLTMPEPSMQRSFHLHLADPAAGEGKRPRLQELGPFGDFA